MKKRTAISLVLVLCMVCQGGCTGKNSESSEDSVNVQEHSTEEEQWELVEEAYEFCFPLVMEYWTMKTATNTEDTDTAGKAPVNQLIHAKRLAGAEDKSIVTPNVDTVYTQAWLDLSEEPLVFVMPQADRYFQTQILDAWTNTAGILGSGSYLIAGTGYSGPVPEELTLVQVPTDMVWVISRILVDDQEDMENVQAIQQDMVLEPLSSYESGESYVPPKGNYDPQFDTDPLEALLEMTADEFFGTANRLMESNPPADEDQEILERLEEIQIGPGLKFDSSGLKGDTEEHWEKVFETFQKNIPKVAGQYGASLGLWTYYDDPIGDFGTAYDYRAVIAYSGLGANPLDVAYYCRANTDSAGEKLSGEFSYRLHFDSLPPVKEGGFWSVTAYGEDNYLIGNEADKYCVNNRSDLVYNEDGSVDVILSAVPEEPEQNWLPTGSEGFHLYLRIYLPDRDAISNDWTAPSIEKIQAD